MDESLIVFSPNLLLAFAAIVGAYFGERFKVGWYFFIPAFSLLILTFTYEHPQATELVRVIIMLFAAYFFLRVFFGNERDEFSEKSHKSNDDE